MRFPLDELVIKKHNSEYCFWYLADDYMLFGQIRPEILHIALITQRWWKSDTVLYVSKMVNHVILGYDKSIRSFKKEVCQWFLQLLFCYT